MSEIKLWKKSRNILFFSQSDDDFRYMRSKYYKIKTKYWTTINIFLTIIKLRSYKYEFENIISFCNVSTLEWLVFTLFLAKMCQNRKNIIYIECENRLFWLFLVFIYFFLIICLFHILSQLSAFTLHTWQNNNTFRFSSIVWMVCMHNTLTSQLNREFWNIRILTAHA